MSLWSDDEREAVEVDRAPICEHCGVTKLPESSNSPFDTEWVCENPDCDSSD